MGTKLGLAEGLLVGTRVGNVGQDIPSQSGGSSPMMKHSCAVVQSAFSDCKTPRYETLYSPPSPTSLPPPPSITRNVY